MNPTQAAVRTSIFSSPVKPRVIAAQSYTDSGGTLTFNVPRYPGKLCLAMLYSGTGAPTLPTGFTSLATQTISASAVGTRMCYRFLDGSEAPTLTSTTTTATGLILLIDGAISSRAPNISTVANSGSSSTPDPAAVTITAPQTQALIIATFGFATTLANRPTRLPIGFIYANSIYQESGGNNMSFACWMPNNCVSSFNPSAFQVPNTSITSSYTIAVRGA